jgi:hypothetical protein
MTHRKYPHPPEESDAQLEWLRDVVSCVADGRHLLQMADDKKTGVSILERLRHSNALGAYNSQTNEIVLSPSLGLHLVDVATHELTHVEQDIALDCNLGRVEKLDPLQRILYHRLVEGDANARAAFITSQIAAKTGLPLKICYSKHAQRMDKPSSVLASAFRNFQKEQLAATKEYSFAILMTYDHYVVQKSNPFNLQLTEVFTDAARFFKGRAENKTGFYLDAVNFADMLEKTSAYVSPLMRELADARSRKSPD